jgi:hypothetical protein
MRLVVDENVAYHLTYSNRRPVRLAYQPPASSTFLLKKSATSNQPAILFSQNKSAPAISHQPNEQAAGRAVPPTCGVGPKV